MADISLAVIHVATEKPAKLMLVVVIGTTNHNHAHEHIDLRCCNKTHLFMYEKTITPRAV